MHIKQKWARGCTSMLVSWLCKAEFRLYIEYELFKNILFYMLCCLH
jgi:hypothetical protein